MRYTSLSLAGGCLPSLIAILGLCMPDLSTRADELSVARIFSAPDLAGAALRAPQVSPDGRLVTYLQGREDDKDELDLWAFDARNGATRRLVDARELGGGKVTISAEEEARRERQRTAALRGIIEYQFSSDGQQLLIPLGGALYLYDLKARSNPVKQLTRASQQTTDARFSPNGRYVSFISEQNLHIIDVRTGEQRALTEDGGGLVHNGVAEFIAQEEMDRDTGYWWSPDERHIAFTRTDDAPVKEVERFEINAGGAVMYRQRYPLAGTANTEVSLKLVSITDGEIRDLGLTFGADRTDHAYLARVQWFPDSRTLSVQRQSRDQKRLELLAVDIADASTRTLLTETSQHWVELHNDLHFLKRQDAFIWASRRSGYKHLYLHALDGKLIRPLTQGEWMVVGGGEDALVGIDERRGRVYFMANEASPLQRQLYSTTLDTRDASKVQRISREDGWHEVTLLPDHSGYLDSHSSPEQPPSVSMRALDGSLRHWLVRNALDENHPYHPYADSHVPEEFGSLTAADGQRLYYRLIKPANMQPGKRYPVIIDTYGGPHFQYVKQDWMGGARAAQGLFRQVLAQQGFVVFSLDNRGSGFRGTAFETALALRTGKVEIEDQLRGVDYLRSLPFVAPDRIGIMGWSYGGYMSLMALTTTDVFRAGVAGAPVTDWQLYDTHYTERYLSTPQDNAAGYGASAVMPHADRINGSLLLVHGMADDNVLFTHSTMLMEHLQARSLPFEVMTYPGGKHGLIRMPQAGRHYYEMVLRFFKRELMTPAVGH